MKYLISAVLILMLIAVTNSVAGNVQTKYILTHLDSNRIGIQCKAGTQMSTAAISNMLIVSCKPGK